MSNPTTAGPVLTMLALEARTMPETTLEDVQHSLDRATDLEAEDAITVLQTARQDVTALEGEPDIDEARRQELATTLEQRIREVKNRDAYDSELGAAMNPEDDNAP